MFAVYFWAREQSNQLLCIVDAHDPPEVEG